MTVLPIQASEEEIEASKRDPAAITLAVSIIALAEFILLYIGSYIDGKMDGLIGFAFPVLIIGFQFILFRFVFFSNMVRVGNRLFPQNNDAGSGMMFAILFVMFTLILYLLIDFMLGSPTLMLFVPAMNVAAIHSMVTARKFMGLGDGFIMSLVIALIAALILVTVPSMILTGDFIFQFVLMAIIIIAVATAMGYVHSFLVKKYLPVDEDTVGAAVEMTRPFIIFITVIIFSYI